MDELLGWISEQITRLGNALSDWTRCIYETVRASVGGDFASTFLGFVGVFLVGLLVFGGISIATGQPEIVGGYIVGMFVFALVFFGIWFVLELLEAMASCAALVREANTGVSGASPVGTLIASGAITECQDAQDLLAQAQATLEEAQSARDAQARRVNTARRRVRNARNMMYAAGASVAAAFWEPWTIAAAVAAFAAAVALVARRARELAEQVAVLLQREAELLRALADVAAAEALVATLCGALPPASNGVDAGVLGGGPVPASTVMT